MTSVLGVGALASGLVALLLPVRTGMGGRDAAFVAALLLPALVAVVADAVLRRGYRRGPRGGPPGGIRRRRRATGARVPPAR